LAVEDKTRKQFKEAAMERTGTFQSRFYELTADILFRKGGKNGTNITRTELIAAWWKSGSLASLS
jgi:hypothetical protein